MGARNVRIGWPPALSRVVSVEGEVVDGKNRWAAAALAMLALTTANCLCPTGGPADAAEPRVPVIVSVNGVDVDRSTPDGSRPQTFTASLERATVTDGISVYWGPPQEEKLFSIFIGASKEFPLHRGVLTAVNTDAPHTEEHDVFGELGVYGGEIDVLDLAATPDGQITRFDILVSTPGGTGARFGELRMGVPETGSLSATARLLQWPLTGREAPPVPVVDRFRNTTTHPLTVGRARIRGGASRDFRITTDRCRDAVLAPGGECDITTSFTPRQGGPRVSTLVVPTSDDTLTVPLSGSAPLGTSKVVVDGGSPLMVRPLSGTFGPLTAFASGGLDPARPRANFTFLLDETGRQSRSDPLVQRMRLSISNDDGRLRKGSYTVNDAKSPYGFDVTTRNDGCDETHGTMKVRRFDVDAHNQPTYADFRFAGRCLYSGASGKLKTRLQFQVRRDTSAPSRPSALKVHGQEITWKTSRARDLQTTIVRVEPGKWASATSGLLVSVGKRKSATLPPLPAGTTWTISAFSVDKTGNVSKPRQVSLTA